MSRITVIFPFHNNAFEEYKKRDHNVSMFQFSIVYFYDYCSSGVWKMKSSHYPAGILIMPSGKHSVAFALNLALNNSRAFVFNNFFMEICHLWAFMIFSIVSHFETLIRRRRRCRCRLRWWYVLACIPDGWALSRAIALSYQVTILRIANTL